MSCRSCGGAGRRPEASVQVCSPGRRRSQQDSRQAAQGRTQIHELRSVAVTTSLLCALSHCLGSDVTLRSCCFQNSRCCEAVPTKACWICVDQCRPKENLLVVALCCKMPLASGQVKSPLNPWNHQGILLLTVLINLLYHDSILRGFTKKNLCASPA